MTTPIRSSRRARRPRSLWPGRLRKSAVLAGAVLALLFGLAKAAEGGAQGPEATLTIQPGDTLWAIAASRYPGSDVRAKVWQIEQANHLSGETLQPGQTIQVPSR